MILRHAPSLMAACTVLMALCCRWMWVTGQHGQAILWAALTVLGVAVTFVLVHVTPGGSDE